MGVFKAIGNGIGTAFRRPRVLLTLWAVNVMCALLIVAPFSVLIKSDLGHSLLGRGLELLDILWLGEFAYRYQSAAPALAASFLVPFFLYLGLYVFLNGGIIGSLLDRDGRPGLGAFFGDCGRYFWRFGRIFLASLILYGLAFGVILGFLSRLLKPILDQARTPWTPFWLAWLRAGLSILLLSLVHMILDYTRILVVAENERSVRRALRKALAFLGRRFFRSWSLYLLIGAGLVTGAALYFALVRLIPGSGLAGLGLGLLWGQAFIVFRLWTKILFFAAQAEYYQSEHDRWP